MEPRIQYAQTMDVVSMDLKAEQEKTLATHRRKYGLLAGGLFSAMDFLYCRRRTLSKFKVLEVVARVPYQAWEHVAYIAFTHKYGTPDYARRIFEFVSEARKQQDNEQWHLLLLEEMVQKKEIRESFFRHRLVPQFLAFFYYHVTWVLYVCKPEWSYGLIVDFEDHAEHEYMEFVQENPRLEAEPFESIFEGDYGTFDNTADLFRRIGLDERQHKEESLARMQSARFS